MTISLDEHHASTLSDEELSAINGDDLSDEDRDLLQLVAGDGDDGDDDDEDDDEPSDEVGDDDDQDGDADPETIAAANADSAAAQPPASERQPAASYQAAVLPADFQEQISATHTAQSDLLQRFQEGDLEVSEYVAELSKITEQRDALMAAKIKAEISHEMEEQASAREWQQAVHRFLDRVAKSEQVDYRTDAARARDLDTFVKVLANDPENAQQSSEWFLQEAHKLVNARRGTVPATGNENPPTKGRPAPRKPDLKAVPKTLAHVPGSDGPGDVSDEFGNVDALDGLDLESAIARMTPAQREKYARAG